MFLGFIYVFTPIGMALELIEDREVSGGIPILVYYFANLSQFETSHLSLADSCKEPASRERPDLWPLLRLLLHRPWLHDALHPRRSPGPYSGLLTMHILQDTSLQLENYVTLYVYTTLCRFLTSPP